MTARAALAALLSLCLAAPAIAEPRAAGLRPLPNTPEGGLWDVMGKVEQQAKDSADVNHDASLNAYVRGVACRVAPEYCSELRIYVMDRPYLNASMAPNGYTEVYSGLLLRAQDEAQLAFVLGHETAHFAENHTLEQHEKRKSRANTAMALTAVVAGVSLAASMSTTDPQSVNDLYDSAGRLVDLIYFNAIASLFAFGREQEIEADLLGLRRAAQAGYDPHAGPAAWRQVIGETKASDFKKVRESEARLGILASHPLASTRAAGLDAEAARLPAGGESGRERHRAAVRPFLESWLKDDLRRRDFGQTLYLIDQLAAGGEDLGVLNFYRGEAYRLRRNDGDLALAARAYEASVVQPDAPVAAWRELGDARRKCGDKSGAAEALRAYLERSPQAEDAWLVKDTLNALQQGI